MAHSHRVCFCMGSEWPHIVDNTLIQYEVIKYAAELFTR